MGNTFLVAKIKNLNFFGGVLEIRDIYIYIYIFFFGGGGGW